MIERLLHSGFPAAGAEVFGDPTDARLFPDERELLKAKQGRGARQFTAARHCAHQALEALGVPSEPVLRNEFGAPTWPKDVVGAITHTTGCRIAVAAYSADLAGIGIDVEPHREASSGLVRAATRPEERPHLAELTANRPGVPWGRVVASAKEAIYKVWSPLMNAKLGVSSFHQVAVAIDPEAQTFEAKLYMPVPEIGGKPMTTVPGRFTVGDGFIATMAYVRQPGKPADRTFKGVLPTVARGVAPVTQLAARGRTYDNDLWLADNSWALRHLGPRQERATRQIRTTSR